MTKSSCYATLLLFTTCLFAHSVHTYTNEAQVGNHNEIILLLVRCQCIFCCAYSLLLSMFALSEYKLDRIMHAHITLNFFTERLCVCKDNMHQLE